MHILYLARLVLVQLGSELKVVPFLMSEERWKGLYVLLLGFVPSALYSTVSATFFLFF